jgi:hypothetical protein
MLAAILLAATLPLGVWPPDAGPTATVVDDVEFYLVEPEDEYFILATQQLAPPLAKAEPASLKRLTALARRLGADAVVLLAELAEKDIPENPDEPLPQGKRFVTAVFVTFDSASDAEPGPTLTRFRPTHLQRATARARVSAGESKGRQARRREIARPLAPSRMKIVDCTSVRHCTGEADRATVRKPAPRARISR